MKPKKKTKKKEMSGLEQYVKALKKWRKLRDKNTNEWHRYWNTFFLIRGFKKEPMSVDELMSKRPERYHYEKEN